MLELQHASEFCSHCMPGKCMRTDPFLPRTLAEDVAVQVFEQFTLLCVPLLGFPLSSPAIWTLNTHDDKVHYGGPTDPELIQA